MARVALLKVWSLTAPWSGQRPIEAPRGAPGLYVTEFQIDDVAAAANVFPLIGVATVWQPETGAAVPVPMALGPDDGKPGDRPQSATAWDVTAFQFAKSRWPHTMPLSGLTTPLRTRLSTKGEPNGPFAKDDRSSKPSMDSIHSFRRLQSAAATRGSFARLITSAPLAGTGSANIRWWLLFRFPFRTPLLGDVAGDLPPDQGGMLDSRILNAFCSEDIRAGFAAGAPAFRVDEDTDRAEALAGGGARQPYFAGALVGPQSQPKPSLVTLANVVESVAINAPALTVLRNLKYFSDTDTDATHGPRMEARLAATAELADGIWWNKRRVQDSGPSDNQGDYGDNPDEATLGFDNLPGLLDGTLTPKDLASNPKRPSHDDPVELPTKPILTALTSLSPAGAEAQPSFAPDLELLRLFGLVALSTHAPKTVAAPSAFDAKAQTPPYHYLHTRIVQPWTPGSRPSDAEPRTFEWRRWVRIEDPAGRPGASTDVLIRVRQGQARPDAKLGELAHAIDLGSTTAHYTVRIEGLRDSHALQIWSENVAASAREAARDALGDRVPSLAPDLIGAPSPAPGQWVLELHCAETHAAPVELGPSHCQPAIRADFVRGGRLFKAKAAPGAAGWFDGDLPIAGTDNTLRASALRMPGLADHVGAPLTVAASDVAFMSPASTEDDSVSDARPKRMLAFSFADGRAAFEPHRVKITFEPGGDLTGGQTVAIGAFDLGVRAADGFAGELWVSVREDPLHYGVRSVSRSAHDADGAGLTLAEVTPAGVDDDDRRREDLSLIWADRPLERPLQLGFRDQFAAGANRRQVNLSLSRRAGNSVSSKSPKSVCVVVLDRAPMSVASVTTNLALASGPSDVVATWSSLDRVWRLVSDEPPTAILALPPQGLNEAWERRKHDSGPSDYLPYDQLNAGDRAPSCLTPTASLQIQTEARARNPAAAWNLRRLLADPTVDTPGAALQTITSLEALYGLEAHDSKTPGMRIAELAAWRGAPRDVPADAPPERKGPWTAAHDALAHRLAVLDVRDDADWTARPLIEDVNFRLRPPAPGGKGGRYPQPTETDPNVPHWTWDEAGVMGGALYGFEDSGLLRSLLEDAEHGVGSLDGLQLSALGAWTRPRAGFNGGLTQISANVEMGRTHEARFERFGRISILRTRAKHVIVYRRAFLPSRQFFGDQDRHLGRPIVRKVEEYIEIIQPVRTFAGDEGAGVAETGFFLGARFRTIRIPVHGSWRFPLGRAEAPLTPPRTVADSIGYAIPLWREGADPAVYPYPHAEALVATDARPPVGEPEGRRITNLGLLRFYTLFNAGPDVEAWPTLRDIDVGDRELDSPLSEARSPKPTDFEHASGPATKLPSAPIMPAALAPFTLTLEPGPPVNVAYGRSDKPLMAQVESVTLMRASAVVKAVVKDPVVNGKSAALAAPVNGKSVALAAADKIEAAREAARAALAELRAEAKAGTASLADLKRMALALTEPGGALRAAADAITEAKNLPTVNGVLGAAQITCGWVDDEAAKVTSAIASVEQRLNGWIDELAAAVADWTTRRADIIKQLSLVEGLLAGVEPPGAMARRLFGEALKKVGDDLAVQLARLGAGVDGGAAELESAVAGALGQLMAEVRSIADAAQAALNGLDPNALNLGPARAAAEKLRGRARLLLDAADTITARAGQIERVAHAAADAVAARAPGVAATLRNASLAIAPAAARAARLLCDAAARIAVLAGSLETAIQTLESDATAALDALRAALEGVIASFTLTAGAFSDQALEDVRRGLGGAQTSAHDAIQGLKDAVTKAKADALTAAAAIPPPAIDATFVGAMTALCAQIKLVKAAASSAQAPPILDQLRIARDDLTSALSMGAGELQTAKTAACGFVTDLAAGPATWLQSETQALADLATQVTAASDVSALERALEQAAMSVDRAAERSAAYVREELSRFTGEAGAFLPSNTVRAFRFAGLSPIMDGLVFNRDRIAGFLDETKQIVITPVTALLEQAGQQLRGVGVTLPVLGLQDALLPPVGDFFKDLKHAGELAESQTVERILRDFAGLKEFLAGLNMSKDLGKAVKISHAVDLKTRTAWVEADIEFAPESGELFHFGAFAVRVEKPEFTGQIRYDRSASGAQARRATARLQSTWVMMLGGAPLVRIRDAAAVYDDRTGLSYDIKPQNIEFDGAMQAISNVLQTFSGKHSPVKIEMVTEDGRPVGVKSTYDMPPTTLTAGGFTIINASLGVGLELAQRSEFEIRASAYLGRRTSPFSMVVTFLGGGGYMEVMAIYRPATRAIDVEVHISLGATAGYGFTLGPLEGFVQIYFGVDCSYVTRSGGGQLLIAGVIVIDGSVSAWGIVTVNLEVALSLTYDGGNHAVGRGEIEVEVQVSRFFSLSYSNQYTKTI